MPEEWKGIGDAEGESFDLFDLFQGGKAGKIVYDDRHGVAQVLTPRNTNILQFSRGRVGGKHVGEGS